MDLSKNAINGAGVGATVLILAVGGMFIAKPQFNAATEFKKQEQSVADSRNTQEIKLAALKSQEKNLPELQRSMQAAKVQIPDTEDIGSIGRVVVEALDADVKLMTFSHQPMVAWEPLLPPVVMLEEAPPPFEPAEITIAPGASPVEEPTGPPVLHGVPMTIVLQSKSTDAITAYADRLSQGDRLILVAQMQVTGSEAGDDLVNATIYAFGFANAPSAAPPSIETPATE